MDKNSKGAFVVTCASVNTRPGYQRIQLDVCKTFTDLWSAEDFYNSVITEVLQRHTNGFNFDNYDQHACDIYTADDVNYHIELREV